MVSRWSLPLLLGLVVPAALLPGQVSLADLPAVARARAERARPEQEKALEPYWADLALDYRNNQDFLDKRITQAAGLGDAIVPLLIERLQPAQSSDAARNTAANCRRVLEQLDPASFFDALLELANGKAQPAREHAIRLLGYAETPKAGDALTDLFDRTSGDEQRLVLAGLRRREAGKAAPKVVAMLGSSDRNVREEVLRYLIAARPPEVATTVAQAMAGEPDERMLSLYIDYFGAAVRGSDAVARALLPLLDREKLDWQDMRRLVQSLATIAPKEHAPTVQRLGALLEVEEPSSISIEAAVTMRALGEKQGVTKVQKQLADLLRKPNRRREAGLFELRANLYFAIGEYGDAAADYEKVLEYNTALSMTRRAYVGLIRCEAHRRKTSSAIKHMKASGMLVADLVALGKDDDAIRVMLEQDKVRSFLEQLAKDQAPK